MGCCGTTVKYLLFILNFLFVLVGIALIAGGSVLLAEVEDWSTIADDVHSGLRTPQITLIVLGALIFVIAFFGCCGALRESRCMLITYVICVVLIFLVQVAIGIYALVALSDDSIGDALFQIFNQRDDASMAAFDGLQTTMKCCGVTGRVDYDAHGWTIPDSCCPDQDCSRLDNYFEAGCESKIQDFMAVAKSTLGGIAIGLAVLEIVVIIFASGRAHKAGQ